MAGSKRKKQIPGQQYTFVNQKTKETDSGILPNELGVSNDFVYWNSHDAVWKSRKFCLAQMAAQHKGLGRFGLLSRMRHIISGSKQNAKRFGYKPICDAPEVLVVHWDEQHGFCKACGSPLELLNADYDHDHETGLGRGFIHHQCNVAEGSIAPLTDDEILNLIHYVRPSLVVGR